MEKSRNNIDDMTLNVSVKNGIKYAKDNFRAAVRMLMPVSLVIAVVSAVAWGSNIGSINVYIHNDYADESLTVKFPKFNAKDVEVVCINDYTQEEMLQCSVSSKGIKLQVPHELGYIRENYKVQIRYKHVYTEVDVNIIFKDTKD